MRDARVVLHVHSNWSYDGYWRLSDIARFYGALGIDAVLMTEHDTGFDPARFTEYQANCAAASTRRCTLIPGIEYSCPKNDIHVLTSGLRHFLSEHRPILETLQAVQEAGGVAILAHPVRRDAWSKFDPGWIPYLSGIELWNRKSDGITWSRRAWDLIQETGLPATVGQDFHRMRHFYPLTLRIARTAQNASLEDMLITALRNGEGTPNVFGRKILNTSGVPNTKIHDRLERLRRVMLRKQ